MTTRNDGLDNPCSPNSGSMTWHKVEALADEATAVESYEWDGDNFVVEWCDGNKSTFTDATKAWNEIQAMDAN